MTTKQFTLLLSFLILLLVQPSKTQYYQYDEPISTSSSVFTDPIRRALGLWGRLLNRMAQTSPPTDDQLHLTKTTEEMPEQIQEVPLNPARIQQPGSFSNLGAAGKGPVAGSANRIIDEQKLLELLPRIRSPSTTTTTTVEIPSTNTIVVTATTTPSLTTTVTKTTTKKSKKKGKKKTVSTKTSAETTTTSVTTTPKSKLTVTGNNKLPQSNITNKTLTVRMRTLDTLFNSENTTFEDVLIKNSNISMDKAMEKETEDLISEIESVLNDEQWIVAGSNHKGVTNKTKEPSTTTTIATTTSGLDQLDQDGSGESSEEDQSEESEESSEEEEDGVDMPATVKSAESNDSLKSTPTARTTTTTIKPKASKGTSTTASPTTSKSSTTTTKPKPKKLRNPSKKKPVGNSSPNINVTKYIPEAEEEEIAGDISQLQLDSSTALPLVKMCSMLILSTPVNSIIDGIGPLILPLIGYSRQAISQYYPRRLEGTPTYTPENQQEIPLSSLQPQQQSAVQQQQAQYSPPRRQYGQPSRPQLPQYPPSRPQPTMSAAEAKHIAEMMQRRSQQNQQNQQIQQSRNFKHFSEVNRMVGGAPTPNLSNRIVNAETVGNGPRSRFMPNPPATSSLVEQMQQQTPMPTIFASDAIRRALANILNRAGESPIVRQISGSNVAETPYYPPEIPQYSRYGENVVRESYNGFQSTATAVDPEKLGFTLK
uniref:Uncharacterized protein n=1 Tax=Ditylenchus dipsaci TaxID=166011 RepID=A0A915EQ21_9BILA